MGARTLAAATFPPIPRPPGGAYPASRASETSKFGFPVETAPLHWEVFQISISNRDVTEIEIVIRHGHRNSISSQYLISIGMCFFKAPLSFPEGESHARALLCDFPAPWRLHSSVRFIIKFKTLGLSSDFRARTYIQHRDHTMHVIAVQRTSDSPLIRLFSPPKPGTPVTKWSWL